MTINSVFSVHKISPIGTFVENLKATFKKFKAPCVQLIRKSFHDFSIELLRLMLILLLDEEKAHGTKKKVQEGSLASMVKPLTEKRCDELAKEYIERRIHLASLLGTLLYPMSLVRKIFGKHLLSPAEMQLVRPFHQRCVVMENEGIVLALAYSADGKQLAVGDMGYNGNNKVTIYNLEMEVQVVKEHEEQIRALVYSPDGKQLAVGDNSKKVTIYNVATMDVEAVKEHEDRVSALVYSPDGKQLAVGAKKLTIYNLV